LQPANGNGLEVLANGVLGGLSFISKSMARSRFDGQLCRFSDAGTHDANHALPAAGVRKAPRHEIAVGERRRCRNYGDFTAGSGVDVVERGGNAGNFATRHVRELNFAIVDHSPALHNVQPFSVRRAVDVGPVRNVVGN
jgi:hypothetical protein